MDGVVRHEMDLPALALLGSCGWEHRHRAGGPWLRRKRSGSDGRGRSVLRRRRRRHRSRRIVDADDVVQTLARPAAKSQQLQRGNAQRGRREGLVE